jgi:hypothetical protein
MCDQWSPDQPTADERELIKMSFRTGTSVVGSQAGQRHVSSETVHRDAVARSATEVPDGRNCQPDPSGDGAAETGHAGRGRR